MAILKNNSTTKNTSSSPSSLHPPYFQMISEAITTMKDRTGSSQPAIAKFIEINYTKTLPPNFKKVLSVQLKKFVNSEKLIKIKNSYKIPAAVKVKTKSAVEITEKKMEVSRKAVEKAKKTKRLSQVKTPDGFRKTKTAAGKGSVGGEKLQKRKALTPMKRKGSAISVKSGVKSPAKKAKI